MAEIGKDILKAKIYLDRGEVVAIPTETVYGLAGNATNPDAVAQIFKVKNRPHFDPLILHTHNLAAVQHLLQEIPEKAYKLSQKFWPGPVTILLEKKTLLPDLITAGMNRVAVRVPNHPLSFELLRKLDYPLVAPSANPFGYISPTSAKHVEDQLGNQIKYILDGGTCNIGIESTIVGWEGDKSIIYRLGGVTKEALEDILGPIELLPHSSSNPKAPGMLKSHYAPRKKIILGNLDELIEEYKDKKLGIIAFKETILAKADIKQVILAPDGEMETAAKNLFSSLRALDEENVDIILAEEVPSHGLGRAINDRLRRAAAPR